MSSPTSNAPSTRPCTLPASPPVPGPVHAAVAPDKRPVPHRPFRFSTFSAEQLVAIHDLALRSGFHGAAAPSPASGEATAGGCGQCKTPGGCGRAKAQPLEAELRAAAVGTPAGIEIARTSRPTQGPARRALGDGNPPMDLLRGPPVSVDPDMDANDLLTQWARWNHRCNASLWYEEDLARRTRVPDSEIAASKRAIDRYNQQRNDAVERMDGLIMEALQRADIPRSEDAPLHSETPGAMIDRLSILALKIQAMTAQALREDVEPPHRTQCLQRAAVLEQQRRDLTGCLSRLMRDLAAGRVRFNLYRQYKMYNDPTLNPALVAEARQA
ncbi:DUF4254 domain-containing protein [Roseateles amylovorans]|uniref:DUF4254 domain-containing protein n=1 Tax=Roseateles amylovorans TaxID=2978473 RepID=A0ABY6B127_9BURK|nr:DUF4254 domain-containing protein [Roseateles amylovorans]UXH77689.1 DUF4254 domain-containing protein [Roseateles amylovorans]